VTSVLFFESIDNFRWHHHIPNIHTDLHYGLVINYPEGIIGYAAFMDGFDRATILSKLPKSAMASPVRVANIAHCEELVAKEVSEQIGIFYSTTGFA